MIFYNYSTVSRTRPTKSAVTKTTLQHSPTCATQRLLRLRWHVRAEHDQRFSINYWRSRQQRNLNWCYRLNRVPALALPQ